VAAALLRRRWEVDLGAGRRLGAAMVGLGITLPLLPHNPGLPCPLRTLTGVPCPACGMTTSVKAVCAGHLRAAVAANPFGVLAVAVAVVLLVRRPAARYASLPILPLVAMAGLSWAWELHRFHWI